jgi:hypothetical protein
MTFNDKLKFLLEHCLDSDRIKNTSIKYTPDNHFEYITEYKFNITDDVENNKTGSHYLQVDNLTEAKNLLKAFFSQCTTNTVDNAVDSFLEAHPVDVTKFLHLSIY